MFVKLPYAVNINLAVNNPNLQLAATYTYRTNSLFDPDYTAAGHQPYQYDQLTNIYTSYIVYGMAYDLWCVDPSVDGLWVGVNSRASANSGAVASGQDLATIMERRLVNMKAINNTGSQKVRFKGYIANWQFTGTTKRGYAMQPEVYGAGYNGNPNWGDIFLSMIVVKPGSGGDGANVQWVGKLTYFAKMYKYLSPGQS